MQKINITAIIITLIAAITILIALFMFNNPAAPQPATSGDDSAGTEENTEELHNDEEAPSEPTEPQDGPDELAPSPEDEDSDEPVACTMDAKQCPDGSFVGRVGPDCEFEACPPVIENPEPVACTMDVKECPDGSYVGREAPDCEFTACPTNPNQQLQMY